MIEPDYYTLDRTAEKTGYTKDDLITLAAEGKLSLYVKMGGVPATKFDESIEVPNFARHPELMANHPRVTGVKCVLPEVCKIPDFVLCVFLELPKQPPDFVDILHDKDNAHIFYKFSKRFSLHSLKWFVSADDVARLSKKNTVNETGQTRGASVPVQQTDTESNSAGSGERELTTWLRETWIKEGMKGGTAFFNALKKYKGQTGSPIIDHYTAGKNAGIKWRSSAGNEGETPKKTIQNKVSIFKNTAQQNTVNSKK